MVRSCGRCGGPREFKKRCAACLKLEKQRHYQKHREKIIERVRSYAENNRESIKNRSAEYYRANREYFLSAAKAYREANPLRVADCKRRWAIGAKDSISKNKAAYYQENREAIRAKHREYFKRKPEVRKAHHANRRARKRNAFGSHTSAEWAAIVQKQKSRCANCGKKCKLTVDHIIPLARGGNNMALNIQGLCSICNSSKRAKLTPDAQFSLFDKAEAAMNHQAA